jgi:serine/threonine-protein kinase RsbW
MKFATIGPVTLCIGSSFENIELVQYVCDYVLRPRQVSADSAHAISMALREALANAIKHGNREDPSRRVAVTLEFEGDLFRMTIRDEGVGFRPDTVANPLAPENRLKSSGRGIFYMKTFMDDVRYDFSGGTQVVLEKRLETADTEKREEARE